MGIAICDDSHIDRQRLTCIIKGLHPRDLTLDCYEDGSELLAAYKNEQRYDLVLLDIRMNRMDGFAAIHASLP